MSARRRGEGSPAGARPPVSTDRQRRAAAPRVGLAPLTSDAGASADVAGGRRKRKPRFVL